MEPLRSYLDESFDLKNTKATKKITPQKARELMVARYAEDGLHNAEDIYNYKLILKNFRFLPAYTFTDKDDFLILFLIQDGFKEVHLMNLSSGNGSEQTFALGKSSQMAFATTVKQTIAFLDRYSGPLKLKFETYRERLYKKILDAVLEQHLPDYELTKSYREGSTSIFELRQNPKKMSVGKLKVND